MSSSLHQGGVERQTRAPRFRRAAPPPFRLTPRDLEIVRAVGRYGVLQSTHVDALLAGASVQKLRRRLNLLFHAGYLARPRAQIAAMLERNGSRSLAYILDRKGAQLLAETDGQRPRLRAADTRLPQLEHALAVSDVLVAVELACRGSEQLQMVPFDELLGQAPGRLQDSRSPEEWRVRVRHRGAAQELHLRPDAIFAVRHRALAAQGRPAHKYFFLEADRGTMPIVRPALAQTSILRKLLAYGETHRARLHQSRFGMDNVRVLFVTESRSRLEAMLAAWREHVAAQASPRLFLFIDRERLQAGGATPLTATWLDGEGKEHLLLR